jgi:isoleucyl-tRNA synthetase
MKAVSAALSNFSQHEISLFEKEGRYSIPVTDDESVELMLSEVEISSEDIPGWTVASKGPLTVALDINVTPDLVQEGDAREFVNRIQKIRKDSGFDVTDRIEVRVRPITVSVNHWRNLMTIFAPKFWLTSWN